ncbi:MAG TPA: hypothetical protein VNA15_02930 [Candidatus Angelobacter sp.]|nr:hypothetical protein [Candidatus Angelobacter sp.]
MKRVVLITIVVIVIAAAGVLVTITPYALAGSWSVKITSVTFSDNIDSSLNPQVSFGTAAKYYWVSTASDYYYIIRSGGSIATTNNVVNSTKGNFTGFISWFLINPASQTVSQGNYTFSGPFGNRTHTFTFSADQGVRETGMYKLNLLLSGTAHAINASPATVAGDIRYAWNVP